MRDNPPTPEVPQIQDKRPAITGLLPKNAQQRLLGGLALLMIVVIVFSGTRAAPKRRADAPTIETSVVDPNQARIQDYRTRLEEQARRLAIEEARLEQTRANPARAATPVGPFPPVATPALPAPPVFEGIPSRRDTERNWADLDREKREYLSLYASNIALTYRRPTEEPIPPSADKAPESSRPARISGLDAPAKAYRVLEGTPIETVLTNRLDSSLSGPVNCMVTTDVYSQDRDALLIPKGSRALGETRKVESYGEQRLAVVFHRLVRPDGSTFSLDRFQGLSQVGETGLRDEVNHHYLQVFGVSVAIGAIAGLSQSNTRYSLDESAAQAYQQGVASSLSQSATHILDRYLNVLPTFTVREGYRVKIYLSQDLPLPAYQSRESGN